MKKSLLTLLYIIGMGMSVSAQEYAVPRFHNEESDTAKITSMLIEVDKMRNATPGDNIAAFGQMLLGTPYVAKTLEIAPEQITINMDELDCTTFAETVAALALTLEEKRSSWRDFAYNLQQIRYRKGIVDGYPSRLHYNSDWAVDNIHKGIIEDATTSFPRYSFVTRTLDFMSSNPTLYSALADSANLAGIKQMEVGYRSYRFPYVKTIDLNGKETKSQFRNGDLLALILNSKNLDAGHMGIVVMKDGEPYLLHASQSAGKVVLSDIKLAEFMKRNRKFIGVRVFRLK